MKTGIAAIACAVVVVAAGLALPATRDELQWRFTLRGNTTTDYAAYLTRWPQGRHAAQASAAYDERGWAGAAAGRTVQDYERYLQEHPAGAHVAEARLGVETLHWTSAKRANSMSAYREYLARFASGRFANDVKARIDTLLQDDAAYEAAAKDGSRAAVEKFLADFPGHKREPDALALRRDMSGRDLVDLLDERKVEVRARGAGIRTVTLEVRRLVGHDVGVRVPVGTFFVSRNPDAQNMVATGEHTAALDSDQWVTLTVSAACANRPRDIPSDDDSFVVRRSPQQRELQRLMPALGRANAGSNVEQAAVWIVTDDADYADLGILVSRSAYQVFGGSRVINERETAEAMKILDEAGIDIRQKLIWDDRSEILSGLEDGDLKAWLRAKR
jgi:hypothetical protein